MRLLICTQAVDRDDPVLGFFHRWIEEFAARCEKISVICLRKGAYHVPGNVSVFSLGKETGSGRLRSVLNLYRLLWKLRDEHDVVFVHMNQEYVLLGWGFWKLWGKKILLWRNHAKGNWMTRLAVLFSDEVFCTSPQSFTARFAKTKIMPVGVDTYFFTPNPSVRKKSNSILFLGRIAPVKNVDIFVEALRELKSRGVKFSATIAGGSSEKDEEYEEVIRRKVSAYGLDGAVVFVGAVSQSEALKLYREHELYVNLTPSGSMDKTIFEALASGCTAVVSNKGLLEILGEALITEDDSPEIAGKIEQAFKNQTSHRDFVVEKHSLATLSSEVLHSRDNG